MEKFAWQKAVNSEHGPLKSTTRLLLLVLSVFMGKNGFCFPSTKKIAQASGLSERSVCDHIKVAVEAGWLEKIENTGHGKSWKRNSYKAKKPLMVLKQIQQHKAEGTETLSDGTEPPTEATEPHSTLAPKQVQSNIPVNKSKNISKNNNPVAIEVFDFYVTEIQPRRKSKNRAVKNIQTHMRRGAPVSTLKAAIKNYRSVLDGVDRRFRKDPANFFGINEPYAEDYYPQNFEPPKDYGDRSGKIEEAKAILEFDGQEACRRYCEKAHIDFGGIQ